MKYQTSKKQSIQTILNIFCSRITEQKFIRCLEDKLMNDQIATSNIGRLIVWKKAGNEQGVCSFNGTFNIECSTGSDDSRQQQQR